MKRAILSMILLCIGLYSYAQDCDIHLMAISVDQKDNTPESANEYLYNRLCTAVSHDGISASG